MPGKSKTKALDKAKLVKGLQMIDQARKKRKRSQEAEEELIDIESGLEVLKFLKNHKDDLFEVIKGSTGFKNIESSLDAMNNDINILEASNKELRAKLSISEGRLTRADLSDLSDKCVCVCVCLCVCVHA